MKRLDLFLLRLNGASDDTISLLYVGENFFGFGLEDEQRQVKKAGETRIPAGTYQIKFRPVGEGNVNKTYATNHPDMHKGMLWLQDVPGFEYVYIHIGNKDEHTDGCILVGDTVHSNAHDMEGFVGKSTSSYKRLYPIVAEAIGEGEVYITIVDEDFIRLPEPASKRKPVARTSA